MMNQRDWERYEDSYEKPIRTKKRKTWKQIKEEKRNKKTKWNKKYYWSWNWKSKKMAHSEKFLNYTRCKFKLF